MKKTEMYIVNVLKKLGFVGIGLCAICCLLPIIGAVVGLGAISAYAYYIEKTGMILVILALAALVFKFYKKRKSSNACSGQCDC